MTPLLLFCFHKYYCRKKSYVLKKATVLVLASFNAAYFAASCVFLSIADNLSSSAPFWLLTLRTEKRVSQTDLAARMQTLNVNIDQQMISKIEKNQRQVTDYELAAFCKCLGVSPKDMLADFDSDGVDI